MKFVRVENAPEFAAAMINVGKVEFALIECVNPDALHQRNVNQTKYAPIINAEVRMLSYIIFILDEWVIFHL